MKIKQKILKYWKNPKLIIFFLCSKGFLNWIPDKYYLKLLFKLKLGKELNLNNPQTFNEKIQWLKLYDKNEEYISLVDKIEVKKYFSQKFGDNLIIPNIGVYDKFEEIDFEKLPDSFVIKTNHDSGGIVICKNKNELDLKKTKKKINKSLKMKFFYLGREWPYKFVKPRIIIEKYMDSHDGQLIDYKYMCFNGKVKLILVCSDRFLDLKETFFDSEWNLLEVKRPNHEIDMKIKKPYNFEKMKKLAEDIARNKKFVRVDFYEVDNKIYFGEITFYPASGFSKFEPEIWDNLLGDWIDIN